MLRKRQRREIMWAAAVSMALAATVSWWTVIENGERGADLVAPIGFTAAALIWLANVLLAQREAKVTQGEIR